RGGGRPQRECPPRRGRPPPATGRRGGGRCRAPAGRSATGAWPCRKRRNWIGRNGRDQVRTRTNALAREPRGGDRGAARARILRLRDRLRGEVLDGLRLRRGARR